jgi:predicted metal-dependent hydrolase
MESFIEREHMILIAKGIELYNQEKFWECHEELEDPWMELRGEGAQYVFWFVIQVATSLFHVRQKNLAGAIGMHKKAMEKLKKIDQFGAESDILRKYLNWDRFRQLVSTIPKQATLEDFEELYQFRFPRPDKWPAHFKEESR